MSTDALADSAYAASATLTRLKADLERSESEGRALRAELADLRAGTTASTESSARLGADLRDRESDLMKLRSLLEQRDEELATRTGTVRKKDERIAQLREDAKRQAGESFEKLEELQAKLRAEVQRGAAMVAEQDALKKEAQAARAEASRLQNEQSALAGGEMVVVQSMAAELQTVQAARQQAEDALARAHDELAAAQSARGEHMARWEQERQGLQKQLAERSVAPPPPPAKAAAAPEEDPARQEWMAEKTLMSERLAKAEKRAIDTMTRFLAIQGEKTKLAGERNALRAELETQKTLLQAQQTAEATREALSTLGDGDANKTGAGADDAPACAETASPRRAVMLSPARGPEGGGDDVVQPSPDHGPEEASGLTPMGGDDEDDGEEVLAEEDVEEYAQDILGMELPRDAEYLWIAEEALHQTELPSGWSEYLDADGRPYYNHPSQPHSTYEHPVDTYHKALYEFHRAQEYGTDDHAAAAADPEYEEAVSQLQQELARSPARLAVSASPAAAAAKNSPANFVDAFWWGATYKSWLSKKSGTVGASITSVRRNWNKRYFAIGAMGFPTRISWAKNPGKETASEYVDLDHNTILIEDDERKGKKNRFCVQTQGRELWLEANSKSDKKDWLAVIKAAINGADMEADD